MNFRIETLASFSAENGEFSFLTGQINVRLRTFIVNRSLRQIFLKLFKLTILVWTFTIMWKRNILSQESYFEGLDNKIIGFVHAYSIVSDDRFFTVWNPHGSWYKLQIYQINKIAHHPVAQSSRCLRNDERTFLLPVLETESRDYNNISMDQ